MSIYEYHILKGLNLPEERVRNLLPFTEVVHCDAGDVVIAKDTHHNDWHHLVTGFVNAAVPGADGHSTTVAIYGPGAWFGEASFVNGKPAEKEFTCLTPVRLICIPRTLASSIFEVEAEFTRYIARLVSWRSSRQSAVLVLQKMGSPALRTMMGLTLFAESIANGSSHLAGNRSENTLEIPVKQETLASLCGVSRGVFSKCVQQLATAGWLKLEYSTLHILNIKAWASFARIFYKNHLSSTKVEMPTLLALIAEAAHLVERAPEKNAEIQAPFVRRSTD